MNRSSNYVTVLAGVATELRFESRFIDIEERTVAGEFQCLLQLSIIPMVVCFGLGPDLVRKVAPISGYGRRLLQL